MRRLKICLDPGHGGADPGAPGVDGTTREEDMALDMALRAGNLFRAAGHETILTREIDKAVSLSQRATIAKDNHCDYFLSIHCNSATTPYARGIHIYTHGKEGDDLGHRSSFWADNLERELEYLTPWNTAMVSERKDTQLYGSGFSVLRNTYREMPAILLEMGFLSNETDLSLLKLPIVRQSAMLAVVCGTVAHMVSQDGEI